MEELIWPAEAINVNEGHHAQRSRIRWQVGAKRLKLYILASKTNVGPTANAFKEITEQDLFANIDGKAVALKRC